MTTLRTDSLLRRSVAVEAIDTLAAAPQITIFAGAGISMEVQLPSWDRLVRVLLATVVTKTEALRSAPLSPSDRDVAATNAAKLVFSQQGPLGAAAVVKAFRSDRAAYMQDVYDAVYGRRNPVPGPTALAIARLWRCFADPTCCRVVTTNFDRLIELALERMGERDVASVIAAPDLGCARYPVVHLHGVLHENGSRPTDGSTETLVLAEDEFVAPDATAEMRRDLCEERLQTTPCLFVGMSLSDPNLLGYLYRSPAAAHKRYIVATSQREDDDAPRKVSATALAIRRELAEERLRGLGVTVLDANHFAEGGQLLREIARHRAATPSEPYARAIYAFEHRMSTWSQRARETGALPSAADGRYADAQQTLSSALAAAVERLRQLMSDVPALRNRDERLALHVWASEPDPGDLVLVAHSDRVATAAVSLQRARIELPTDRLVVEAFCNGTVVEAEADALGSARWGSMVAVPVVLGDDAVTPDGLPIDRLPVGVVVLASTASGPHMGLGRLGAERSTAREIYAALASCGRAVLSLGWSRAPQDAPAVAPPGPRRATRSIAGASRLGDHTVVHGALPDDVEAAAPWDDVGAVLLGGLTTTGS